ncbi:MAG: hypothetical protein QM778_37890 [Myxococcales bacterium]
MWRSAPRKGARLGSARDGFTVLACVVSLVGLSACKPEFEPLSDERSARGSLGEEVYKALCRRVAGTEMPDDLDGRETEVLCLHSASEAEQELANRPGAFPPRLVALAQRRARIVRAVDDTLPVGVGDELELLMRQLLPFYDPPEERIQNNTRAFAALLRKIAADSNALEALQRVARDGMLSREGSFGLYRGLLSYDELNGLFSALLPVLTQDASVRPYFETTLVGMALELATSELDDAPDSDTRLMKDLLSRTHPEFGSGRALFVTKRDVRGMPLPTAVDGQAVPFPFVDEDRDGLADVAGAEFVVDGRFGRDLPEPFAEISEQGVARDEAGRACALQADGTPECARTLYQTQDADLTMLSGALREAAKLFDGQSQTAVHVARLVPAIFGDRVEHPEVYGKATLKYSAPDTSKSPIVDLVHASTAVLDRPLYEQSLELTQTLVDEHEAVLVEALNPLLALERRTRTQGDAYPGAKLAKDSTFWDQLLFEAERISRRRKTADGPTLLELLLRGALGYARNPSNGGVVERVIDPNVLKHQGALIATLMRYKDEWRNNPLGESKRAPSDPRTIGSFRIPVDRSPGAKDSPATCGKDGCGGVIDGSPFERWKTSPTQNCMVQREGRPVTGKDCGAPSNQSILQRSMGLIWEMAGRSQCNKAISLGDLLDFAVLKDPCQNLESSLCTPGNNDCACAVDADCKAIFGGNDFACDTSANRCIAKAESDSCKALKQQQRADRQKQIDNAENKVFKDYACPKDQPAAFCNGMADADKYPAAFYDPDGPVNGVPSTLLECHLINLPDVGRSFGRALSHEFTIDIPNPWMKRYLTDVALAKNPGRPDCANDFRITNPYEDPGCVTSSAKLSREVYTEMTYERVHELGQLIAWLMDDSSLFTNSKDSQELRPEVAALTRVLFAPPGSSSFLMFDPLLIRGAPAACQPGGNIPECTLDDSMGKLGETCCIADLKAPPFRYRLDTYYGATSFAWEHPVTFTDGTQLSLLDAMKTLADGVNRTDFELGVDDPKNFEGTDFLFSTLGQVVGQHYDSPGNPLAQNTAPNGPFYRSLTNIVSYEDLMADALDDGSLDVNQPAPHEGTLFDGANLPSGPNRQLGLIYHSYPLLELFETLQVGGTDALSFSAKLGELLLNPHASCAPDGGDLRVIDGKGACDALASGVTPSPDRCDGAAARPEGYRKPLTYRDGRATICWNDGTCFDKPGDCRWASPLYLALDALGGIDDRIGDSTTLNDAFDGARAGLFDTYFSTDDAQLKDRRLRALLLVGLGYVRERWAKEAAAGTLATLGPETVQDTVDLIEGPVFAGGLGVVEQLSANEQATAALNRYVNAVLGGGQSDAQVRALVATFADVLELLPGDQNVLALMHVMASSVLANPDAIVASGWPQKADGSVSSPTEVLQSGMIWRSLDLMREVSNKDSRRVLDRVLNNVVALPGYGTSEERAAPMVELYDVLLAINRPVPGAHGSLSSQDWAQVFNSIADVMLDERRGFERLYEIVQCRNGSTDKVKCE